MIPTLLGLIAVHEAGHLVAGLAVGFPFNRFTVGLFAVERVGGRARVRLNTAWLQPAAYVVFPALPDGRTSAWRRAAMVAAGPLANLLVGGACLLAAAALHPGLPDAILPNARGSWRSVSLLMPGSLGTAQLNVAGLLSLGVGLVNLVPGRSGGLRTDGGQLLDLFRGMAVKSSLGDH